MPFIAWDSKYLTGNAEVDRQHQDLFAMVNALHDAITMAQGKELIIPTIDKLAAYVAKHFKTEESLMKSKNYPHLSEHKFAHDDLARKAAELIDGYRSGKLVLSFTLSRFLGDWLKVHILEEDMKLMTWLRTRR